MFPDTFGTKFRDIFFRDIFATDITAGATHLPAPVEHADLKVHGLRIMAIGTMDNLPILHFGLFDNVPDVLTN